MVFTPTVMVRGVSALLGRANSLAEKVNTASSLVHGGSSVAIH